MTLESPNFHSMQFSNETASNGLINDCVKSMCFIFYIPVLIVMTISNTFFALMSYFGFVASIGFAAFSFTAFFTISPHPLFIVAGVASLCVAAFFFSMITAVSESNRVMNQVFT